MSKNAIPALIIVGAVGYVAYKKLNPSSKAALAVKNAIGAVQGAIAGPRQAPEIVGSGNLWSDKSTSLYLDRTSPAPDPPNISGLDTSRDYVLDSILQLPSAVPINGNVS